MPPPAARIVAMAMGPRDEYKASYPDPTTGLRWALAVVSVIAVAAVIAAVTLWLKPRHVEQPPPKEKASTGVPRADLEQITGQLLLQKFPGPPVRITCPDEDSRVVSFPGAQDVAHRTWRTRLGAQGHRTPSVQRIHLTIRHRVDR